MKRILLAICPALIGLTVADIGAQSQLARYRVVSSGGKTAEFETQLNEAVKTGYQLRWGSAAAQIAILEKSSEPPREYRVMTDLRKGIAKIEPGFRIVPQTASGVDRVILERSPQTDRGAAYDGVFAFNTTRGLERDLLKRVGDGYRPISMSEWQGNYGILVERNNPQANGIGTADPQRKPYLVLATTQTGPMTTELLDAAAPGYRVVSAAGARDVVILMQHTGPRADYQLVATERTDTFESELNAAAATGYRLLPTALFWTTRRAALRGQITELIGVVEKQPDARPLHYRLLAVRRVPTLAAELAAAASDGYEFSTMATGAELAVVLHKQP